LIFERSVLKQNHFIIDFNQFFFVATEFVYRSCQTSVILSKIANQRILIDWPNDDGGLDPKDNLRVCE
jgi:hypothetical protein